MIEAAEGGEALVERALAGMSKRRMTEVMGESQRLGQVLVETKRAGERSRHLRHLQRVGKPGAVVVALVKYKDLSLVLEATKGGRVDDPVAIATKRAAAPACRLRVKPAPASLRIARIGRAKRYGIDRHRSLPGLCD